MAQLLRRANLELDVSDTFGSLPFSLLTAARIYAPIEDYERLRSLSGDEQEEILRALREIYPPRERDIEIARIEFLVDSSALTANEPTHDSFLGLDLLSPAGPQPSPNERYLL